MTPIHLASKSDADSWTSAALSWLLQDHPATADICLLNLTREQVLKAWHKVNALQSKLAQRHAYLTEAAADAEIPAPAPHTSPSGRLAPIGNQPTADCNVAAQGRANREPVPDGVDGFEIHGRACPYCGKDPCPDRWEHDRFDAANEVTWWRRAVKR